MYCIISVIVVSLADIASRSLTLLWFEPSTTIPLAGTQLEMMSWSACEILKNDNYFPSLLLCLSQVVLVSTLQAVKVSPLIERISDHKEFKKLLRTRTNVLVLYTKSGECRAYVIEYNAVSMAAFKHVHMIWCRIPEHHDLHGLQKFCMSKGFAFLHSSTSAKYLIVHLLVGEDVCHVYCT